MKLAVEAITSGTLLHEIAAAVAVVVDRVLEVVRGQELRLAELAGPRADHLRGRQVAAVDDAQRVHQLAAEHLRAAAVVGQRRQRAQHRQLAHAGAEVALERPEGGDHRARHAVLLLDLGEQVAVLLELGGAALDAVLRDQLAGRTPMKLCAKKLCLRSREMMPGSRSCRRGRRRSWRARCRWRPPPCGSPSSQRSKLPVFWQLALAARRCLLGGCRGVAACACQHHDNRCQLRRRLAHGCCLPMLRVSRLGQMRARGRFVKRFALGRGQTLRANRSRITSGEPSRGV